MKKIALVADVEGWAFDIAAQIIKNALSNQFQIDIFYAKSEKFDNNLFKILEYLKDYNIIHFFWRKILLDFESDDFKKQITEKYNDYNKYINNIIPKISTGVYDHLFENDLNFNKTFTKYCNKYVVSSKTLFNLYYNQVYFKKPTCIMGDSFEKNKFYPINLSRFDDTTKELVIGWVGNSKWNEKQKDEYGNTIDFKGFHTVLKPVIDELTQKKLHIKLYCADKDTNPISNDDMNEYYSKIHLYICVSYNEGTPKPLLEAMGCGVPIITTNVGIAEQALGDLQKKYILDKRIIGKNDKDIKNQLKHKIVFLYNNRNVLKKLSEENIEYSKKYEINYMKNIYYDYFNSF